MRTSRVSKPVTLMIAIVAVTGCGGGGGGGGANPAVAPQPTPATITAANAPAIAAEVYTALVTTVDVAEFTNPVGVGTGSTANVKSRSSVAAIDPNGTILPCIPSGRFSLTVASPVVNHLLAGILVPNDTLALAFENCDDGVGFVIDGTINVVVRNFDGNVMQDRYRLEADFTITDVALTADAETSTVNADMTVVFDQLNLPISEFRISGGTIDERTATGSTRMTDFLIETVTDESGAGIGFTTTGSGALTSSEFVGEVMFNVTVPFESRNLDNPTVGTLVITGAGGASITLRAFDAVSAQLDVDPGNGGPVETLIVAWSELF